MKILSAFLLTVFLVGCASTAEQRVREIEEQPRVTDDPKLYQEAKKREKSKWPAIAWLECKKQEDGCIKSEGWWISDADYHLIDQAIDNWGNTIVSWYDAYVDAVARGNSFAAMANKYENISIEYEKLEAICSITLAEERSRAELRTWMGWGVNLGLMALGVANCN